jgi:hypothetical protein
MPVVTLFAGKARAGAIAGIIVGAGRGQLYVFTVAYDIDRRR